MQEVRAFAEAVQAQWSQVISGQDRLLQRLLIVALTGGNALIEGPPGTAKTSAVKALARCLDLPFGRIQFTPDLLPADLLGAPVLDPGAGTFRVRKGPIFTTFLLADEINRAPAKTQSALLEAMEERQVTLEGQRWPLPEAFTVFATQNPLEFEGTYPLPEAQLDRFTLNVRVGYPAPDAERAFLARVHAGFDARDLDHLTPAADTDALLAMRRQIQEGVRATDEVLDYLLALIRATRDSPRILLGASPRAAAALLTTAKARAALDGRDYLTPDDVLDLAPDALRHRLVLHGEAELSGLTPDRALAELAAALPVPR